MPADAFAASVSSGGPAVSRYDIDVAISVGASVNVAPAPTSPISVRYRNPADWSSTRVSTSMPSSYV